MDSRLRGNDSKGEFGMVSVIPAQAGIHEHPKACEVPQGWERGHVGGNRARWPNSEILDFERRQVSGRTEAEDPPVE